MRRGAIERRLATGGRRLADATEELRVGEHQLAQLTEEAEEARLRALVSETPLTRREHRDAQREADTVARHLAGVRAQIGRLAEEQDRLLDELGHD